MFVPCKVIKLFSFGLSFLYYESINQILSFEYRLIQLIKSLLCKQEIWIPTHIDRRERIELLLDY